jgi:hypothetical protein
MENMTMMKMTKPSKDVPLVKAKQWPFPVSYPMTKAIPWTAKQIKEYDAWKLSQAEDALL